jgi:hypothetical protein
MWIVLAGLATVIPGDPRANTAYAGSSPSPTPLSPPTDLYVEATVSTAGPYGELWVLRVTPGGDALLHTYYSASPSGSLMAEFSLSDESVDKLRAAIESERFFELPADISPRVSPLHQPDLQMEITLGGRKRKVRVYDPGQLKGDQGVKRFMAVWTRLYEGLPLKPTW